MLAVEQPLHDSRMQQLPRRQPCGTAACDSHGGMQHVRHCCPARRCRHLVCSPARCVPSGWDHTQAAAPPLPPCPRTAQSQCDGTPASQGAAMSSVNQRGKQLLAGTLGSSRPAEGARRTAAANMLAANCLHTLLEQPAAAARTLRWPPPRCRDVITPCALRPPVRDRPSVSGLKGPPFHRPLRDVMMRPRKPAARGPLVSVLLARQPAAKAQCGRQCAAPRPHPPPSRTVFASVVACGGSAHLAWWACTPSAPRL